MYYYYFCAVSVTILLFMTILLSTSHIYPSSVFSTNTDACKNSTRNSCIDNVSIHGFVKRLNHKKSVCVNIVERFTLGRTDMFIPFPPVYNILKMATALVLPVDNYNTHDNNIDYTGLYLNKNKFSIICCDGNINYAELYATLCMVQVLTHPQNYIILNHYDNDNNAYHVWKRLCDHDIITWDKVVHHHENQKWVVGSFCNVDINKSISEYILDTMTIAVFQISVRNHNVVYYQTSQERENEIYHAYRQDETYVVNNITTAIHAVVLNSLLNISIQIKHNYPQKNKTEQILYDQGLRFIQTCFPRKVLTTTSVPL